MHQPRLSKSRFMAGQQCTLRLWLDAYRRNLASPPDESQQAIFEIGHEVGELARDRWPDGVLVEGDPREVNAAVRRTQALMADPEVSVIYEAAIVHAGALTRVDVLIRDEGERWHLVEVKSGTRVKEQFETDAAVQYWILVGAGVAVASAGLLVLNRDYEYPGGDYDLERLFRYEDLTEICRSRWGEIGETVTTYKSILQEDEPPVIAMGRHCHTPYRCPFREHCAEGITFPENPVEDLPGLQQGRKDQLAARGIRSIEEIPGDFRLNELQERVRSSVVADREWVSSGLRGALENVDWPLFFLDFEAVQFALPQFIGSRPWDAIPFQFSCHRQEGPERESVHGEFLATAAGDPRPALAEALVETLGERGSILTWSGYEARTIRILANALPHLRSELLALQGRLVDLLAITRRHYYHPGFKGSYSIKSVLPVLVPGLSYTDLEVADGQAAGRAWVEMLESDDPGERQRLEQALRDYCALDTRAMFELRNALLAR